MKTMFPLTICTNAEECKKLAEEEAEEDALYTYEITCGTNKLVASFVALALASII